MYINDASSSASLTNTWNTIGENTTAFTEGATSSNWSYSSNYLLAANNAAVEGLYSMKYSLSFEGANVAWEVGISINGAAPTEPIFTRTISSAKKDRGNISGIMMASISQGDTVRLQIRPAATNSSFTPIHCQVALIKAAQQSENYYGGMHVSTDQLYNNIGATFIKLTGFAAIDEMNGWSFSASGLTADSVNAAGTYYISFSGCHVGFGNDNSPETYSFEICRNDSNGVTRALADRITSANDLGNVSTACIVEIDTGDVITVEGRAHGSNTDLTLKKATLSLFKLVDSTDVKYAGMKITSDQTVTISAQNTWTTVGAFTNAGTDGWLFKSASNNFTPWSTDTYGYHFLEYAISCTTANAGGDDVEFAIFIGSNQSSAFTTIRKLSSNTDVGSICGIGLFKVEGIDSTVTLKVRNTTSSNNITIKKAMVGTQQIRYVYSDTALPITLSDFTAVQDKSHVKISWETASETDNALFLIYRNDEVITSIEGAGNSSKPHFYQYIDQYVIPGKSYTYTLADVSFASVEVKHNDHAISLTIDEGNIGKEFSIGNAYPNPFNPKAVIPLNLAKETRVLAELYDIKGHMVQELHNGSLGAGSYDLNINGYRLAAGIYFVKIRIQEEVLYTKVTLLK